MERLADGNVCQLPMAGPGGFGQKHADAAFFSQSPRFREPIRGKRWAAAGRGICLLPFLRTSPGKNLPQTGGPDFPGLEAGGFAGGRKRPERKARRFPQAVEIFSAHLRGKTYKHGKNCL